MFEVARGTMSTLYSELLSAFPLRSAATDWSPRLYQECFLQEPHRAQLLLGTLSGLRSNYIHEQNKASILAFLSDHDHLTDL